MTDDGVPPVRGAVETITPEAAKALLEHNPRNRNLRPQKVKSLAGAMRRGEWTLNGESIKVATDGSLVDGQHRLEATVEANVPLTTFVVRGLPMASQETIDTGARRTVGDMLKLRGELNANNLASSLRYLWYYITTTSLKQPGVEPTTQELIALLDRHPLLRDSIPQGSRASKAVKFTPAAATAMHYLFAAVDEAEADAFFERLCDGVGLEADSPIIVLRRTLLSAAQRPQQPNASIKAAWAVKAFNAWREGRTVASVAWRPGGVSPEAFPRIVDLELEELDAELAAK